MLWCAYGMGVVIVENASVQQGSRLVLIAFHGLKLRGRKSSDLCIRWGVTGDVPAGSPTSGGVGRYYVVSLGRTGAEGGLSKQRPGHGRRQPARGGEDPVVEQPGAVLGEGRDLRGAQQPGELTPRLAVEPVEDPGDAVALLLGQLLGQPSPQDHAQLALHMEGQTVVHAVAVTIGHGEDVGALAVSIVDEHVEHRHPAQRRRVPVGQDEPSPLPVLALLTV